MNPQRGSAPIEKAWKPDQRRYPEQPVAVAGRQHREVALAEESGGAATQLARLQHADEPVSLAPDTSAFLNRQFTLVEAGSHQRHPLLLMEVYQSCH
jgi:hypothetical protein